MCVYIYIYTYVCVYIYIYIYMYTYMYMYMICIFICVCVCMHIYIYTHINVISECGVSSRLHRLRAVIIIIASGVTLHVHVFFTRKRHVGAHCMMRQGMNCGVQCRITSSHLLQLRTYSAIR